MRKQVIVVIFGGKSSEYEVSLASAYAIVTHIDTEKYEVITIGITRLGQWYIFEGEYQGIKNDTWHNACHTEVVVSVQADKKELLIFEEAKVSSKAIDAVFPVLHGKNGEDGTLQGMLQLATIPVIGCDMLSSAICMDKDKAHTLVATSGIRVPKTIVLHRYKAIQNRQIQALGLPVFVKPMKAGSSIGITRVTETEQLAQVIEQAFIYDDTIIIEENIDGFEVGCAILGTHTLYVGEIDEIELSKGFFDYQEKYTLQSSMIHMPARISDALKQRVQEVAKRIYQVLGCKVFARVDMFITENEEIVFNEVNTIPGFTTHSRYPSMMLGIGLSFFMLVNRIIEEGIYNS